MPRVVDMNGVTTVTGSEQVTTLGMNADGSYKPGGISLNPFNLNGTWLARQATLFNKYKYVRATLRYVPFCPTNTQGRLGMAYIGDSGDDAPTSMMLLSQYQGSCEAPVWMPCQINMGITRKPEFTVNAAQTPENQPGAFVFASDLGTTGTGTGSFILDYTIQFWSRAAYADNK